MPRSKESAAWLREALYTKYRLSNYTWSIELHKMQVTQFWYYIKKARQTYHKGLQESSPD